MCLNYKVESRRKYCDKRRLRHTEVEEQPCTKSQKSGGKGSVTWHNIKLRETKVHREELCKSVNLKNAIRVRQTLRIRNQETLQQERCAPHRSLGLGENCLEAQSEGHGHVLLPTNAGTLFEKARATFRDGLRSWGSHFWMTPRDGPFLKFWCGATYHWRMWRCNLISIFQFSVE